MQSVDYQVFLTNAEKGRPESYYRISVSCLEYLTVRANRQVFEVYLQRRQAVKNPKKKRAGPPEGSPTRPPGQAGN